MNKWSNAGLLFLGMVCNAFGSYPIEYWQVQLFQSGKLKDFFLYETDFGNTVVMVTHEGNKIDCDAKKAYKKERYLKTNPPMVDIYSLIIDDDYELDINNGDFFKIVGRNRKIKIGNIINHGFVEREKPTPDSRPMISQSTETILK